MTFKQAAIRRNNQIKKAFIIFSFLIGLIVTFTNK
jgi:hypothetical protein